MGALGHSVLAVRKCKDLQCGAVSVQGPREGRRSLPASIPLVYPGCSCQDPAAGIFKSSLFTTSRNDRQWMAIYYMPPGIFSDSCFSCSFTQIWDSAFHLYFCNRLFPISHVLKWWVLDLRFSFQSNVRQLATKPNFQAICTPNLLLLFGQSQPF